MSRNPNKTYCTMPGCRNWAMRGHERCRWHTTEASTTQDGARGPGAPLHNLNALKHGASANPLAQAKLEELIASVLAGGDDLPCQFGLAVSSIYDRTGDAFSKQSGDPRSEAEGTTLLALRRLLAQVIPRSAAEILGTKWRSRASRDELRGTSFEGRASRDEPRGTSSEGQQARDRTVAQIER